jgi:hypothetical protein
LTGLGVGAVVTTAGLVVYLAAVARLALDYERNALVVQGGWIAVRLLAIVTVVAAALLLNRVRDLRGRVVQPAGVVPETHRRGAAVVVVLRTGFWAIVLGATTLLVTLAYWGAYQLGI